MLWTDCGRSARTSIPKRRILVNISPRPNPPPNEQSSQRGPPFPIGLGLQLATLCARSMVDLRWVVLHAESNKGGKGRDYFE
jgi:hypothetical protein